MKLASASWWYTAAELAELGLPGLPADARRLRDTIKDAGWANRLAVDGTPLTRQRSARGGGTEFHVTLLPAPAQEALIARRAKDAPAPIATNDSAPAEADLWAWYEALSNKAKATAVQRQEILLEIEALVFAGAGRTAAANAVASKHGLSPRAIGDWRARVAGVPSAGWLPRLASQYKGGGKQADIDPEAWQILLSDYLRLCKPAFASCYNRVLEEFCRPRGITLPDMSTLRRRANKEIRQREKIAKREGKEALRKTIPPLIRSVKDLHAMEAVNADGHVCDVFVRWEDGTIGRPIMVGIQDVYSRKVLAHRIGRTESTELIRRTFADLFRDWGIPKHVSQDNGRGFTSKAMTGGMKTRFRGKVREYEQTGVLTYLGIHVHWTLPFRGSSKPIERTWGSLVEHIAKHPAMEGAYTGNKPNAKPENYHNRAIPIEEFRAHVVRQLALHNARPGRRTETAMGRSFDDVFDESFRSSVIREASEEQMRMALLEAREATCHKQHGSVTFLGNSYHNEGLLDWRGKKVIVRFDPENLHSDVYIYDPKGPYLFPAQLRAPVGFLNTESAKSRAKDEAKLRKNERENEKLNERLNAARVAELYSGHAEPAPPPKPTPAATRLVAVRGHVAAALKPTQQAVSDPDNLAFFDKVCAGSARLRPVE
jgi:hypothetical protein